MANFGEAVINNIFYVLMELCQSPTIQYRQQYLDPIDGMTKFRIAERPWSDTTDWSALAHQIAEFNALKSNYQAQRQSLW